MILRPLQSPKQSHWHRLHRYIDLLGSWCVARTLPVWVDSYRLRLPRNYVRLFTKDYDTRWWRLFLSVPWFWGEMFLIISHKYPYLITGVIWSYRILVASFEPPARPLSSSLSHCHKMPAKNPQAIINLSFCLKSSIFHHWVPSNQSNLSNHPTIKSSDFDTFWMVLR